MKRITRDQVRKLLAKECKLAGSQLALACKLGVSPPAINAVLKGKRKPHACILRFLGLKKVDMYETAECRDE